MKPVPVGAVHVYNVPVGTIPFRPSVGDTLKVSPLQIVVLIVVITAVGLIVIVIVNVAPVHAPDNGVTIYTAVCVVFNGFVKVPLIVV